MKDEQRQVAENGQEPLELLHKIDEVMENRFGARVKEALAETPPFELHLPEIPENPDDQTRILTDAQRAFYLKGSSTTGLEGMLPLHLSDYRNMDQLRYDFPLILNASGGKRLLPLRSWIDTLITDSGLSGSDGHFLKQEMLKLEGLLKEEVTIKKTVSFVTALKHGIKTLRDKTSHQNGSTAIIEKIFKTAIDSINANELLLDYGHGLYPVFIKSLLQNQIKVALENQAPDLAYRHASIQALVNSGETASTAARKENADWDNEIDFEKLNEITASLPQNHISAERMKRLKIIVSILDKWMTLLDETGREKLAESLQVPTVAQALKLAGERKTAAADFFKAYHMAGVEMENKYAPAKHGAFFDSYDAAMLNANERALVFPVVLDLDSTFEQEIPALMEILNSEEAIKVRIRETAPLTNLSDGTIVPGVAGAFSRMALGHAQVAVCQTALAFLPAQQDELIAAFACNEPALITFFDGLDDDKVTSVPAWLLSGMAPESRIFANFSYNPANGETLAKRFTLHQTPAMENDWPLRSVVLLQGTETVAQNIPFSAVEFCAVQPEFASHFKIISPAEHHKKQVPFTTFISEPHYHQEGYLPFILMADKETGEIRRVLIDRKVVEAAYRVLQNWRYLQELAGINNSHVAYKTATLRDEWNIEKDQALDAVKAEYETRLNQDRENLTEEIIENIAAGLLSSDHIQMGGKATVSTPVAATPVKPAVDDTAAPEEKAPENIENDEDLNFDEAYIDTPLCTSCNECCNQNDLLFLYDDNKQAYIGDLNKGSFKDLVTAAENCPVHIIHPGKPQNPDEPNLDDLLERAQKFN